MIFVLKRATAGCIIKLVKADHLNMQRGFPSVRVIIVPGVV